MRGKVQRKKKKQRTAGATNRKSLLRRKNAHMASLLSSKTVKQKKTKMTPAEIKEFAARNRISITKAKARLRAQGKL